MALVRVPADALRARQAADARHVHLRYVDAADVHEGAELRDVTDLFAGGDADRALCAEPRVSLQVVGVQRLLQPGEAELLELPGPPDRGRRVPAQPRIDHEFDPLAQS